MKFDENSIKQMLAHTRLEHRGVSSIAPGQCCQKKKAVQCYTSSFTHTHTHAPPPHTHILSDFPFLHPFRLFPTGYVLFLIVSFESVTITVVHFAFHCLGNATLIRSVYGSTVFVRAREGKRI